MVVYALLSSELDGIRVCGDTHMLAAFRMSSSSRAAFLFRETFEEVGRVSCSLFS